MLQTSRLTRKILKMQISTEPKKGSPKSKGDSTNHGLFLMFHVNLWKCISSSAGGKTAHPCLGPLWLAKGCCVGLLPQIVLRAVFLSPRACRGQENIQHAMHCPGLMPEGASSTDSFVELPQALVATGLARPSLRYPWLPLVWAFLLSIGRA